MRLVFALLTVLILAAAPRAAPGDITAVPDFTPGPPRQAGSATDLVTAMSARYHRTLALLKAEFPSDYATLMSEIAGVSWQAGTTDTTLVAAFQMFTALKRKYADKLLFAPSSNHALMLGRLADFYFAVFKNEGSRVCGRFARDGSAVLFELGLSDKYADALDLQSLAYFEAVVKAIEAPDYSGVAGNEDWSAILGIMVAAGAPQSYVATIAAGDSNDPDLCPALAAMLRTSGLLNTPEGLRTRADFARNLTGY